MPLPVWLIATSPDFWQTAHPAVAWIFLIFGLFLAGLEFFHELLGQGCFTADDEGTGWAMLGMAALGVVFGAGSIAILVALALFAIVRQGMNA